MKYVQVEKQSAAMKYMGAITSQLATKLFKVQYQSSTGSPTNNHRRTKRYPGHPGFTVRVIYLADNNTWSSFYL